MATTKIEEPDISPLVKSFSIENVNVPVDFDYKMELANVKTKNTCDENFDRYKYFNRFTH